MGVELQSKSLFESFSKWKGSIISSSFSWNGFLNVKAEGILKLTLFTFEKEASKNSLKKGLIHSGFFLLAFWLQSSEFFKKFLQLLSNFSFHGFHMKAPLKGIRRNPHFIAEMKFKYVPSLAFEGTYDVILLFPLPMIFTT